MGRIVQVNDDGPIVSLFSRRRLRRALKESGFKRLFWSRPASEIYRKDETEATITNKYHVQVPRYNRDPDTGTKETNRHFYTFGVQFSGDIEPELDRKLGDWFHERSSGLVRSL